MACTGTGRGQLDVWTPCPGWFSLFGFYVWCNVKGSLWCMGAKAVGSGVSPCGCQNQPGNAWVDVWLNFGCFMCAESTPSSGEMELQVPMVLEGGWALSAHTGNCSSSSCWQILACLYYHLCPSVHVDSSFPSCSADINYERLSLLKLDLPALSLLRWFECCNTA